MTVETVGKIVLYGGLAILGAMLVGQQVTDGFPLITAIVDGLGRLF